MPTSQLSPVIQHLRRAVLLQDGWGLTDGQLLEGFINRHEEAALAALVRRHGPMVWGVCRRVLRNHHDAEDAFQAAFLVLVRKAASVVPREMVANWLYGVAYQTAFKARATAAKRRTRERQVVDMPETEAAPQDRCHDLQSLLDQELSRLPDKYRLPIVVCELEGKTRKEASRQLGWPEGTVAGRLARARALLGKRLARHGLVLSGMSLAALLAQNAAAACMPAPLLASTIKAATLFAAGTAAATAGVSATVAALTEGVLKAMLLTKLKITAALLVAIAVLGTGAGFLMHPAQAEKPTGQAVLREKAPEKTEVSGVVKAVDAAQFTLTIQNKAFGQKTFGVAKDAKILIDDGTGKKTGVRLGSLADLSKGAIATLKLSPQQRVLLVHVEGPHLQGILKALDAAAKTITVTVDTATKGKPPVDKTFQVTDDTVVAIDDKPGTKVKSTTKKVKGTTYQLADVKTGAFVTMKLSGDQKVVGHILAQGRTVSGVLKAIEAAKNTITLGVKDGQKGVDQTFAVALEAKVLIDGSKGEKSKPGKVTDLVPGAQVTVRLSLDQRAVAIMAQGSILNGILKAVDAAKNTITITVGQKGEQPEDKVLDVAKDATIHIDGSRKGLADLPTQASVMVKLSALHNAAITILAEGPGLVGVVKENAGNDSITIGGKGGEQTFNVAKDAKVLIDGKEGKWSDLIDGSVVKGRLSADKKEVIGTMAAEGPSFRGVVKAVDTDNNTITLTIGGKNGVGGEDKTFNLTKDSRVVTALYGVPLRLADLKAESEVVLRLFINQKAAARITLQGQ